MPRPLLQINSFGKGISLDDRHQQTGFSSVVGLDIYAKPGTVQLSRDAENTNDSVVDDQVLHFETSDTSGIDTKYAYAENGDIYSATAWTWSLGRAVSNSDGEGLQAFAGNLYYFRTTDVGRLSGSTWTDTYWTGTLGESAINGSASHPSIVFARKLYFAHSNIVSTIASDETTVEAEALVLPEGYEIYSMKQWNSYIVLGTKNSDIKDERVILWDGVSDTISQEIVVPKPGVTALENYNNSLKAFIGGKIFRFTGSEFDVEKDFSVKGSDTENYQSVYVDNGAVEIFNEKLLFGVESRSGAEDFVYGIYAMGRHSLETETALSIPFLSSNGNTTTEITAMRTLGENVGKQELVFAWKDGSNYGIDRLVASDVIESGAYLLTNVLNLREDVGRVIKGIKVDWFDDSGGSSEIVVKYREDHNIDEQDDDSNFTTLGTITTSNRDDIMYLHSLAKKIQFRLEFSADNADADPNIRLENIYIY